MNGGFGRNKRRIEETKRKRREEKRLKKLNKPAVPVEDGAVAPDAQEQTPGQETLQ